MKRIYGQLEDEVEIMVGLQHSEVISLLHDSTLQLHGVNNPPSFTSSTPIHQLTYCTPVSVLLLPLQALLAKSANALLVSKLRECLSGALGRPSWCSLLFT